jgi:hypothetical protein
MAATTTQTRLGLPIDFLLRPNQSDCTNGGLSATHAGALIVGIINDGQLRRPLLAPVPRDWQVLTECEQRPAVYLRRRVVAGRPVWSIVPAPQVDPDAGALAAYLSGWMAGGNYATGDSRLSRALGFYGAVAVHDRREG